MPAGKKHFDILTTDDENKIKELIWALYEIYHERGIVELSQFHQDNINFVFRQRDGFKNTFEVWPWIGRVELTTERFVIEYRHQLQWQKSWIFISEKKIPKLPVPHKPPFIWIQLKIEWKDGYGEGGKLFDDVHQLAAFLKDNPSIASALKYISNANQKKD